MYFIIVLVIRSRCVRPDSSKKLSCEWVHSEARLQPHRSAQTPTGPTTGAGRGRLPPLPPA